MKTAKILLIEDQFLIAFDMKHQLIEMDYSVVGIFSDAEEGLSFLEKTLDKPNFPDVIVSDISLRGKMTGLEFFKIVEAKYNCEFVFISGYIDLKLFNETIRTRPSVFVNKPFDIGFVHNAIQISLYRLELKNENRQLKQELEKIKGQG
ncbi:MAG: response regulator [Bacteroidota bacterium]